MVEALGWEAAVRLDGDELRFAISTEGAPHALSAMGRRATPLAKDQAEAPKDVVDRPKGVPRLSRALERPED